MGAIPILTGMDLTLISNMGVGTDMVTEFMVLLACWRLPDIFTEEYQKSAFCMKKRTLHISAVFHRHSDDRNLVCQSVGSYRSSGDRMRHLYSGDVCLHAGPIPVCEGKTGKERRQIKKRNGEET